MMQLLASILLLHQLVWSMDSQPSFVGNAKYIWDKVFDEFKLQNEQQKFYNPRNQDSSIDYDAILDSEVWKNNQEKKKRIFEVGAEFMKKFGGKDFLEYKQLYTYSEDLPKEAVVGKTVRTSVKTCDIILCRSSGIIKATTYSPENEKNYYEYYLMEWNVSYDVYDPSFYKKEVYMSDVLAGIRWKEIKSMEVVYREKQSYLTFIRLFKQDPFIYKFNEYNKLEIQVLLEDTNELDFWNGFNYTYAENFFTYPSSIVPGNRLLNSVMQKFTDPKYQAAAIICFGAICFKIGKMMK